MTIEENGFHFRRVGAETGSGSRWASSSSAGTARPRCARTSSRTGAPGSPSYPRAAGAPVQRAWAGFYDMTPDAHPILGQVGDGVYAACGFSGHGFMQSPAVGDAVSAELLGETPPFDLAPYRLERFAAGAVFPETLVLSFSPAARRAAPRSRRSPRGRSRRRWRRARPRSPGSARSPARGACSSPSPETVRVRALVMNWFRLVPSRSAACASSAWSVRGIRSRSRPLGVDFVRCSDLGGR